MTATVTALKTPDVQSWTWFFDTEDEAQLFLGGYKDELADDPEFDYVDSEVGYEAGDGSWKLRVDYIDHRRPDLVA